MAAVTRSPEQSKTTHSGDDVEEEEEETQEREAKRMKTNPASVEAAASDNGDAELKISSPLCEPYIPDELKDPYRYPGISAAYDVAEAEFYEKQGHLSLPSPTPPLSLSHPCDLAADRVNNLPTRQYFHSPVLPVRDPGRKAALSTARSLLRLSSSLGTRRHHPALCIDAA